MPVPKRRKSKARRDQRRAHHQKAPVVSLSTCPRCGEPKSPHRVCANCGFYRGKDILRLEVSKHGV